jgi:uncharacterized protein (DUF1697 family)
MSSMQPTLALRRVVGRYWQDQGVPTYVALLRGVNVGGRNKVAMSDLREVVTSLGHTGVATYIQSGNVVFSSRGRNATTLAGALEQKIAEVLGVRSHVVVLSRAELAQVIADNPFPDETNAKHLHAMFTAGDLVPAQLAGVEAAEQRARERGSPDEVRVVGRTLFLRTPEGIGRSELAVQLARSSGAEDAQVVGTARNWATVLKLMALLDAKPV